MLLFMDYDFGATIGDSALLLCVLHARVFIPMHRAAYMKKYYDKRTCFFCFVLLLLLLFIIYFLRFAL